jgi:hypothetical protein
MEQIPRPWWRFKTSLSQAFSSVAKEKKLAPNNMPHYPLS